jgi:hypothetical protein
MARVAEGIERRRLLKMRLQEREEDKREAHYLAVANMR